MKWVKVSERLPEKDQAVLVYDAHNKQINWALYNYDWVICAECRDLLPRDYIKYWSELPEPPKGNE